MKFESKARTYAEAADMGWFELAKYCLLNGIEFSEAYACDRMTREERAQFHEYKTAYLNYVLADCPF